MTQPTVQPPKITAEDILEMICSGHFGSPDSLLIEKRRKEWPQVRPAILEVLDELHRLRDRVKELEMK